MLATIHGFLPSPSIVPDFQGKYSRYSKKDVQGALDMGDRLNILTNIGVQDLLCLFICLFMFSHLRELVSISNADLCPR